MPPKNGVFGNANCWVLPSNGYWEKGRKARSGPNGAVDARRSAPRRSLFRQPRSSPTAWSIAQRTDHDAEG